MRRHLSLTVIIVLLVVAAAASFVGFGVWHSASNTPAFDAAGYVLRSDSIQMEQLSFGAGSTYTDTLSGDVKFSDTDGNSHTVPRQSFVHLDTGMMALSDGVLLDFADLTDNFINNYFIQTGLVITRTGSNYTAQTESGAMQFGEHLWKLSDRNYIVVAPTMRLSLGSGGETVTVSDYIQVTVSEDGIVYLLTPERMWMTISESCCIETAGGVRIYPVSQLLMDDTYKLSMAKLSVSADDAIVLTDDETRRQIVPELNITGVDGEDGEDGQNGVDGTAGDSGDDGTAGEDGKSGDGGEGGAEGEGGKTGADGDTGDDGKKGDEGDRGEGGATGNTGVGGGQGAQGNDAVMDSSTNTALPVMTITDWQVTTESLRGTITISDKGNMLSAIAGNNLYPGHVTITNVKTGEEIPCYELYVENGKYSGTIVPGETGFSEIYRMSQVGFSTDGSPLEPDTEYKLSVTAYYKYENDGLELIYSREFITRTFYTDSAGVNLSYASATQNSVTISANTTQQYADGLEQVRVYLLTPQQNEALTAAAIESAGSNTNFYTAVVNLKGSDFRQKLTQLCTMPGLESNKTYIARVYVTNGSTGPNAGLKVLTKQEVEVKTLKQPPQVQKDVTGNDEKPRVVFNRLTGGFEVYAPKVQDPDGGITHYTYTAYQQDPVTGQWSQAGTRKVPVGTGEPIVFYLNSGVNYQFGVTLEFDDNEKLVEYDLGRSETIRTEGDTMPKLTLDPTDGGPEYNQYLGTLTINLGPNSRLETGSASTPLVVELIADSLNDTRHVELTKAEDPVNVNGADDTLGTMHLDTSASTNRATISLDLKNLYKDTNYALAVYGWLSLADGEKGEAQFRHIGTVTFRTYDTAAIVAQYTPLGTDSGAAMGQKLRLRVSSDGYSEARRAYALEELTGGGEASSAPCGAVTTVLYYGVGAGKQQVAQTTFVEKEDLAALFGDGLVITEEDFGSPTITEGGRYTLTVTQIADSSYSNQKLNYVNYYDNIVNPSGETSGILQPPDLLRNPNTAVTAKPILNSQAATFGVAKSNALPDDAVIGFTLEARYDNLQRMGLEVTYYAFEYQAYLNARKDFNHNNVLENGATPLTEMKPLMTMKQPISASSDTVPKVAVLFGGTMTSSDDVGEPDGPVYSNGNGYLVYRTGNAGFDGSLKEGMGRGFRYVFAYEVTYNIGSSDEEGANNSRVYPYDHADYDDYQAMYGSLTVQGEQYGQLYLLNSGVMEAPRILPDFHYYVSSSQQGALEDTGGTVETGTVTLHYSWRDRERENAPEDTANHMVITNSGDINRTVISYDTFNKSSPVGRQDIADSAQQVEGVEGWYELALPFEQKRGDLAVLEPTINISPYRIDYSAYVGSTDATEMKLGPIPVDWGWGQVLSDYTSDDVWVQHTVNTADNIINFYLTGDGKDEVAKRAIAMRVTFSTKEDKPVVKTFTMPMFYHTNGNPGIRVHTSQLGNEFMKKEYMVSDVTLYYDNGAQGWAYAEGNQYHTLQTVGSNGLGTYVGAQPDGNIVAGGALYHRAAETLQESLRNTIDLNNRANDAKIWFLDNTAIYEGKVHASFLYPMQQGVNSDTTESLNSIGPNYIVPKAVSEMKLSFEPGKEPTDPEGGTTGGTMTDMTPTVTRGNLVVTGETVSYTSLKITGLDEGKAVTIALYSNRTAAEKLNVDSNLVASKDVTPDENGNIGQEANLFSGLVNGTTYYYTVSYLNSANEKVLLLDSANANKAIYPVTTATSTNITVTSLDYRNNSYLDKFITGKFNVNPVYRQELRYDIYSTEDRAKEGTQGDVLSHDFMVEHDLITKQDKLAGTENQFTIHLEPRGKRSTVQPGSTYYLKITSYERQDDGSPKPSGYTIKSFHIDPITTYGALFYIPSASVNSITYRVTLTDSEYTLMGKDRDVGALYAVRFTDENNKRIKTIYDNQLYPAFGKGTLLADFTLNAKAVEEDAQFNELGGIKPETNYKIHVYALPDVDHNGEITLGETTYTWTELFEEKDGTCQFQTIINSFWNSNNMSNLTDMDDLERQLLIGSKTQSTTNTSNWLLNRENVFTSRPSANRVRVNLAESIGLIGANNKPVFNRIDWQVEGTITAGQKVVKDSGTARASTSDQLLKLATNQGNEAYYYDIPYDLPQGIYVIVIQFRINETDASAYATLTIRSGV